MKPLATIGYEHATQPDVIARLKTAKVEVVVDVRAVAASRRAGFSKTVLAASLAEAGTHVSAYQMSHTREPAARRWSSHPVKPARDRMRCSSSALG